MGQPTANGVISAGGAEWKAELALHSELFDQLRHRLPAELLVTHSKIEQRLNG